MNTAPVVSVILPVYNAAEFVESAVESVLRQTFTNFELLAIDDGSTDTSAARLESYAIRDARIKVFRQENQGIAAALNRGLQAARGRYLARLDADDRMRRDRLEMQVFTMEADPRLVLVGSAYRDIDPNGRRGKVHTPPLHDTAIRWKMLFQNPFAHPAVMARMEVLKRHQLEYDLEQVAEDYALWSRLIKLGRVGNLPEPMLEYRIHTDQASRTRQKFVAESALDIARCNLGELGFDFDSAQMVQLIAWQRRFPRRLTAEEAELAQRLLGVLDRFSCQPEVDRKVVSRLYGRWTLRMLGAKAPAGSGWRKTVFQRGRPWAVPAYLWSRARGWVW